MHNEGQNIHMLILCGKKQEYSREITWGYIILLNLSLKKYMELHNSIEFVLKHLPHKSPCLLGY